MAVRSTAPLDTPSVEGHAKTAIMFTQSNFLTRNARLAFQRRYIDVLNIIGIFGKIAFIEIHQQAKLRRGDVSGTRSEPRGNSILSAYSASKRPLDSGLRLGIRDRTCGSTQGGDFAPMITSMQMKAARALLGIEQRMLAELSGLSLPTVQRMEASDGDVRGNINSLVKIVSAFNTAGVELIGDGGVSPVGGRGVRLKA
jgi:hypothetical protein